jgi:hypothetical protein
MIYVFIYNSIKYILNHTGGNGDKIYNISWSSIFIIIISNKYIILKKYIKIIGTVEKTGERRVNTFPKVFLKK